MPLHEDVAAKTIVGNSTTRSMCPRTQIRSEFVCPLDYPRRKFDTTRS